MCKERSGFRRTAWKGDLFLRGRDRDSARGGTCRVVLANREQERHQLVAERSAPEAERGYYHSLQIDDAMLDILLNELRKGVLADPATERVTLGRVVKRVEVKTTG